MLKRIKRMWQLSKKDPKALAVLENLSEEQLALVPDEEIGDGKAVFFGEPTDKDYEEFKREEEGTAPWYKRLKQLDDEKL